MTSPPRPLRALLPLATVGALAAAGMLAALIAPRAADSAAPASVAAIPSEGYLVYDVRDGDTGSAIPCKLSFVGADGTSRPAFTRSDIGAQEGEAVLAFDRLMSASGQGVARIPAGSYDVTVSRGPEWDIVVARGMRFTPGTPQRLSARLRHVVDTTGWVSADFHVHSQMSSDSHVPMLHRIHQFLADGVEVITSTDHNVLADYAPLITQIGAGRYLASIIGDEVTTSNWGHFGAFPLPWQPGRAGLGALPIQGKTATDLFADVRRDAPGAIVDVHHPRVDGEMGYFTLAGLDTAKDRSDRAGFSWDFDALEVLNGYLDPERRHIDHLIVDWYNMLERGHLVTATGNSDSHHLDYSIGGYPRNWVQVADDHPSMVRPEMVAAAIKGHHSQFSTAPFIVLRAGRAGIAGIGDTLDAHGGTVHVEVEVRAAPWVSLTDVTLVQSGREVMRWKVAAASSTPVAGGVRFQGAIDLPVERDGWVVARADGDQPLAPVVGDTVHFEVRPLAVTNPIFFDHDGNGRYDAPLARRSRADNQQGDSETGRMPGTFADTQQAL